MGGGLGPFPVDSETVEIARLRETARVTVQELLDDPTASASASASTSSTELRVNNSGVRWLPRAEWLTGALPVTQVADDAPTQEDGAAHDVAAAATTGAGRDATLPPRELVPSRASGWRGQHRAPWQSADEEIAAHVVNALAAVQVPARVTAIERGPSVVSLELAVPRQVQVPRTAALDALLPRPFLRKMIFRLPESLQPGPGMHAFVLGLDLDGNVVANLQYKGEGAFAPVTSAIEVGEYLYLGSLSAPGIGRIRLADVLPEAADDSDDGSEAGDGATEQ